MHSYCGAGCEPTGNAVVLHLSNRCGLSELRDVVVNAREFSPATFLFPRWKPIEYWANACRTSTAKKSSLPRDDSRCCESGGCLHHHSIAGPEHASPRLARHPGAR